MIKNQLKTILRKLFIEFKIDITKNIKYDRLTTEIMKKHLKVDANCIDVGCHKGEVLDEMLKYAPEGTHYAFEPIPFLFKDLANKYSDRALVYEYALAETSGIASFQLVKNDLAYSGLKKRRYDIKTPIIEEIKVEVETLDKIIPKDICIDLIKIDVEGGELGVLKGGAGLLKRCKPLIIFESGLGASDFYGTSADLIFNFLNNNFGYRISLLNNFLKNKDSLSLDEFKETFQTGSDYYFIAH